VFLAPEDMARLKKIDRLNLVLPTRNVSFRGRSLTGSVREALAEFLARPMSGDDPPQRGPAIPALPWLG